MIFEWVVVVQLVIWSMLRISKNNIEVRTYCTAMGSIDSVSQQQRPERKYETWPTVAQGLHTPIRVLGFEL